MVNLLKFYRKYEYELIIVGCVLFLVGYLIYSAYQKKSLKGVRKRNSSSSAWVIPTLKKEDIVSLLLAKLSNIFGGTSSSITRVRSRWSGGDSKGEVECRRVLQAYFPGRQFAKARPDFLRNEVTGGKVNLELDCYQEDLKLGVEYSGRQHYEFVPHFHENKDAFTMQKYRDYMKRNLCEKNGVKLIEVPYTVKVEEIKGYLTSELKKLGY
jgi:hypothetical protein